MDKGNVNKHRYGLTGNGLGKTLSKVVETSKWGADTARERYGKPISGGMRPKDTSKPQFEIDQSRRSGNTPNTYLVGKDEDGRGPNFDKTKFR